MDSSEDKTKDIAYEMAGIWLWWGNIKKETKA